MASHDPWHVRIGAVVVALIAVGSGLYYWRSFASKTPDSAGASQQISGNTLGAGALIINRVEGNVTVIQSGAAAPDAKAKRPPEPEAKDKSASPTPQTPTRPRAVSTALLVEPIKRAAATWPVQSSFVPTGTKAGSVLRISIRLPAQVTQYEAFDCLLEVENISPAPLTGVNVEVDLSKGSPQLLELSERATIEGDRVTFGPWDIGVGQKQFFAIKLNPVHAVGVGPIASATYSIPIK